jgi:hypothetical protein
MIRWAGWGTGAVTLVAIGLAGAAELARGRAPAEQTASRLSWSLAFVAFALVGALVASRRPRNPLGWAFCGIGLFAAVNALVAAFGQWAGSPWAAWVATWLWLPSSVLVVYGVLLFPDGRPPAGRRRLLAWAAVGVAALGLPAWALAPGPLADGLPNPVGLAPAFGPAFEAAQTLDGLCFAAVLLGAVLGLLRRFRAAGARERAQIKWLLYGAAVMPPMVLLAIVTPVVLGKGTLSDTLANVFNAVGSLAIPLAAGVAILKYRLLDIDRLLSRSLAYGVLALAVGATYVGVVAATGGCSARNGATASPWCWPPRSWRWASSQPGAGCNDSPTGSSTATAPRRPSC